MMEQRLCVPPPTRDRNPTRRLSSLNKNGVTIYTHLEIAPKHMLENYDGKALGDQPTNLPCSGLCKG